MTVDVEGLQLGTSQVRSNRVRARLGAWIPTATSLVILIGAWWAYTRFSGVPAALLPAPQKVLVALYVGLFTPTRPQAGFVLNLGVTLESAMIGLGIGVVLGLVLATLAASFTAADRIIMPYAAALQSLPKLAVAPLFLLWFGYGIQSKVVLVTLLVFFPILINTYRGIKETDPLLLDVLRCMRANRLQVLIEAQIPSALPYIFAGLNVGVIDALLGAIVGEFIGASAGIGVQLIQFQYQSDVASVFAALIVLGVVGAILISIVEILRRRIVFWGATR